MTGHLTATNGGQPITGAALRFSDGTTTTTDGAGWFRVPLAGLALVRLTITGPVVTREIGVQLSRDRDVTVDAFVDDGSFDLTYFRQIARGALDHASLQPLRRWTQDPMVYLRTIDEEGRPIAPATLQMVRETVTATAPLFTGGAISLARIEQGLDTREGQAGWVTVKWITAASAYCGRADVGLSGGTIELLAYAKPGCTCNGRTRPRTVRHELGHVLGFWHSGDAADVMYRVGSVCDALPTPRERQYARYLYARPIGNTDPDTDPAAAVFVAPARAIE